MNINIRLLLDSEVAIVNEVYNEAYGNIRPLENFKWEFVNGPWGKAIYVIAEDLDKQGNKIIGTQSAIPMVFINGSGETVLTAKSEDTFVHPDYRGHKLFDKMYDLLFNECRKAGIQYLWGFTYARKPFLKLGFSIPFDTIQGLFVVRPKMSFDYLSNLNESNGIKEKAKISALVVATYFKGVLHKLNRGLKGKIVIGKDYQLKKDVFNQNLKGSSARWSIHQTEKYLDWRLKSNPFANDYIRFTNSNEVGKINSSMLVNYRKEGFAYIEELNISDNKLTSDCKSLIKEVICYSIEKKKIFMLRFWGFDGNETNRIEMKLLKKLGFVFVKKGTAFVWKDLSDGKSKIDPCNILLSRLFTQGNR